MKSLKILLLKSVDPSFDSFSKILESENHHVIMRDKALSLKEMESVTDSFKPDLIIANNNDIFSSAHRPDVNEFEEYLQKKAIPISIWDYEQPMLSGATQLIRRWIENKYPKFPLYFNIDTYWTEEYKKKNLSAHFLPFGVDERLKSFTPSSSFASEVQHDLVYIGTAFVSTMTAPLNTSDESLRSFFVERAAAQVTGQIIEAPENHHFNSSTALKHISNIATQELTKLFSMEIESPVSLYEESEKTAYNIIYQLIPETKFAPADCWHLIRLRAQIGYAYYQVALKLKQLIPHNLKIYGEGCWNQLLPAYPSPIRRLSYEEMYNCWALSKIIFCFTKKLFVNNVHERVLHILGAGGFPLIDKRGDIDILFQPGEVETYTQWEEALEKIKYYIQHDSERKKIIEKGRARVFKEHTYRHRLHDLLKKSSEHFGFKYERSQTISSLPTNSGWIEEISHSPKV